MQVLGLLPLDALGWKAKSNRASVLTAGNRKAHTQEFKAKAVKDAMGEVDTMSAVAARHRVHPS